MPQSLAEEFSMNISIPFEVLLVRVFGAVILCGLIGLEREFHKNTAGLRTNMLIGLAAVTFWQSASRPVSACGRLPLSPQAPVSLSFGRSGACRWPPASRRIDGHQPKRKRSASGSLPPLTAAATISAAIWLKVMPLPPKPITA